MVNYVESGIRVLAALGLAAQALACAPARPVGFDTKKNLPANFEVGELKITDIEASFRRSDLQPDSDGLLTYPIIDFFDISRFCPPGSTGWEIFNRGLHPHGFLKSKGPIFTQMNQGTARLYIEEEAPNGFYRGESIIACNRAAYWKPEAEIQYSIELSN